MLAAGTTLGPYKILSSLGAGGMGEVYRARDTRLGRDVALKVIRAEVARDPDRIKRFEQEARAAGALSHPNVCAIYDIGTHEGSTYVVMELLEGESLREKLRAGPIPARKAIDYAAQAAHGLAAAHEKGIIHRDLKPENLFVTKDGRVKVLDFGLAKLTRPEAVAAADEPTVSIAATEAGRIVGTVGYMSPEQVRGESADARSDLFALGAILYEMLSGKRAFQAASSVETLNAILKEEPARLSATGRNIPAALEIIVRRCLEKSPDERFQSARDLAFDLENVSGIAAGGAPLARPQVTPWLRVASIVGVSLVVVAIAIVVTRNRPKSPSPPSHGRTDIAVLPFQNLSAEGPNTYFAGGLHEELLTQLAKVAALKVISRTSVMGYANTTKPLKEIAGELGVGSIVEGSVQVVGNRLRVNVQLIDAATDEHLWAERYDRTLDDAFAIQSDVAQQVVAAVGATLASEERQAMAAAPTANPQAYLYYLQGEDYRSRAGWARKNLETAQRAYEQAVALDRGFALAHAALSQVHGAMHWDGYDRSPARLARSFEEAETALRLAPELPQAHVAMGVAYYHGRRDYRKAVEEFRIALRGLPGDGNTWASIGYVQRRLGNWKAVQAAYENAIRLNPRNANLFTDLGGSTFTFLHRYAEAVRATDFALTLAPDLEWARLYKSLIYLRWKGNTDTLRVLLDRIPPRAELGASGPAYRWRAYLLLLQRRPKQLLSLIREAPQGLVQTQTTYEPMALYEAWAHELGGDVAAARKAYASAEVILDSAVVNLPDDFRVHAARGLTLAGLGRRRAAIREVEWLRRSVIFRADALWGPDVAAWCVRILLAAGETEVALDELDRILAGPGFLTAPMLRLDPRWDPIREHPRFKALLVKYANPERPAG